MTPQYEFIGFEITEKDIQQIDEAVEKFARAFLMGFWFYVVVPYLLARKFRRKHGRRI